MIARINLTQQVMDVVLAADEAPGLTVKQIEGPMYKIYEIITGDLVYSALRYRGKRWAVRYDPRFFQSEEA